MKSVTWTGLDEFKRAFAALPDELRAEAAAINLASAEAAYTQVFQTYPRGETGNLRKGLRVSKIRDGAKLVTRAPHAHLYELGTKRRSNQAGQNRGQVQPHPTFYPIAERHQREARAAIIRVLYAHGAIRVTDDLVA